VSCSGDGPHAANARQKHNRNNNQSIGFLHGIPPFLFAADIEIIGMIENKHNAPDNQKPGRDTSARLYSPISSYLKYAIPFHLLPDDRQAAPGTPFYRLSHK
jgi:hypothetical protein